MLFKGNNIASFTQLRKRSILFKVSFILIKKQRKSCRKRRSRLDSLLNQRSKLFIGNNIASFTRLKKRSMLFKGKFYFDKETKKKAV